MVCEEDEEEPEALIEAGFAWLWHLRQWLGFYDVQSMCCVSKEWRLRISELLKVQVHFFFKNNDARAQPQRAEARLAMCSGFKWKVTLECSTKDLPLRRVTMRRLCQKAVPCANWEFIRNTKLVMSDTNTLSMVEAGMERNVVGLGRVDAFNQILIMADRYADVGAEILDSTKLKFSYLNLHRLSIDLSMINIASGPMKYITRLKVFAPKFCTTNECIGQRLHYLFPNLNRLSLQPALDALPILSCLPDFNTPEDFKLSLERLDQESSAIPQRKRQSMFMAAHLFPMPLSWGLFFKNVVRLQLTMLAYDFDGIEHIVEITSKLPNLRRLGTIAAKSFAPIIESTTLQLDELVICLDAAESASYVFNAFHRCFEARKRAEKITRLGVHLGCSDGLARVSLPTERAVCAGWLHVARCLAPGGFICFSVDDAQITETKLMQYPWTMPSLFCADTRNYPQMGTVQGSTPLDKQNWYYPANPAHRPIGTLINNEQDPRKDNSRSTDNRRSSFADTTNSSISTTNGLDAAPLMSLVEAVEVLNSS